MFKIEFTQFMFPDGKRQTVHFNTDNQEIAARADTLRTAGLLFEIENQDNRIWATIKSPDETFIQDCFVANGPGVIAATEKLITDAYERFTKQ